MCKAKLSILLHVLGVLAANTIAMCKETCRASNVAVRTHYVIRHHFSFDTTCQHTLTFNSASVTIPLSHFVFGFCHLCLLEWWCCLVRAIGVGLANPVAARLSYIPYISPGASFAGSQIMTLPTLFHLPRASVVYMKHPVWPWLNLISKELIWPIHAKCRFG